MYEIGLDEILGRNPDVSGDPSSYEEIGATGGGVVRQPPQYRQLPPARQQVAAAPAQYPYAGMPLRSVAPTKVREQFLGFQSNGNIAALGLAVITSQPQTYFRPERLIIPGTVGANFSLQDLKVGNTSQLVSGQFGVPCSVFAETAFGVRLKLDTVNPAIFVSLSVQNTDPANPHSFSAAMIGPSIQ